MRSEYSCGRSSGSLLTQFCVLLWASLFAVPVAPVHAEDGFRIYAPSRSTKTLLMLKANPTEEGLTLKLQGKADLGVAGGTITVDTEKRRLYIATPRPSSAGKGTGVVVTLDSQGNIRNKATFEFANGYSYLSLDRKRRFLLGAYYFGGHVDVYRLNESGLPDTIAYQLNEGRKNAHCVLPSPDNRFVYIPYVKDTNALFQYRFDDESGKLEALNPKNANPPEGTGPRHMAYHPNLPIAYFSNEQHIGVSVYKRQPDGQLNIVQVCDALKPGQSNMGISSSDILITSDGRYVFAGIRGHQRDFDWISRYRVQDDGRLKFLGLTPADKIPWGLALSPDEQYLMVSAFQGGSIIAYRIGEGGQLTRAASIECDQQITDLVTLSP